jgi:hypothetical protein
VTEHEAMAIYKAVTAGNSWANPSEVAIWVAVLTSPQQSDVTGEHAKLAVLDLLGEVEPRKIYPALVLTKARSIQKTLAPSTVQLLEAEDERLRLESPREHRQRLTVQDRAALARLAQAFAQQKQMPAFDHLMTTLREKCHLDVGEDDPGESVPF